MLSEKEFIDKVWIDYENYESQKKKKDKFYDKHVYKNRSEERRVGKECS